MIKRLFLSLFLYCFLTVSSFGAIAYDTSGITPDQNIDPLTITAISLGATADIILSSVCLETSGTGGIAATGHTFDGVTMTAIETEQAAGQLVGAWAWYLASPNTGGSRTLSHDLDESETDDTISYISFSGVDTTSPIGNTGVVTGAASSGTISITTANANSYVVVFFHIENHNAKVAESGGPVWTRIHQDKANNLETSVFYRSCGAAGSCDLAWTSSFSDDYIAYWAEVKEDAGAPATKRRVILE